MRFQNGNVDPLDVILPNTGKIMKGVCSQVVHADYSRLQKDKTRRLDKSELVKMTEKR